jgi:hypothetical protein
VCYDSDSASFPAADRNTAGRSRRLQFSHRPANGQRLARCRHQYFRHAGHWGPVWCDCRLGFTLLNAVSAWRPPQLDQAYRQNYRLISWRPPLAFARSIALQRCELDALGLLLTAPVAPCTSRRMLC